MTVKIYTDSKLILEHKGGSKVRVTWAEGSTNTIVDTDRLKQFLDSNNALEDPDLRQFFYKDSRKKLAIATGSFAVDELLLTLLNLDYTIYPDKLARHEVYVPAISDNLAVNITVEVQPALSLSGFAQDLVDAEPPACEAEGCVNLWHTPRPVEQQQCHIGCAVPCHVLYVA